MLVSAVRTLVCVEHHGAVLSEFPVAVRLDTSALVASGALDGDCEDLRVTDLAGADVPFWLEDATCDAPDSTLWLGLDSVGVGVASLVVTASPAPVGPAADGHDVFPLFDDFGPTSTFPTGWDVTGDGNWSVSGGELVATQPTLTMRSTTWALSADDTVLVARIDAQGGQDDDVEIGGGEITSSSLWRGDRSWYGFTHLSWSGAFYSVARGTTPGIACGEDEFPNAPWLPETGDPREWHRVEVGYDGAGGSWLTRDDGLSLVRGAPSLGCIAADPLPVLFVFDHSDAGANVDQYLDYVFVRPVADPAPTAWVVADDPDGDGIPSADEGCGDDDADGLPNYDDPADATIPGDTGSVTPGGSGGAHPADSGTSASEDPTVDSASEPDTSPSEGASSSTGSTDATGPLPPPRASAGASVVAPGCGCAGGGPVGGLLSAALALALARVRAATRGVRIAEPDRGRRITTRPGPG